ncbi:MAG: insulinase family protein [Candidatus Kapabacteria bacterium]|nr:insulinase family protein [Candidatus Kapabacteria bacterium]MDW8011570.1 pitrilysin family protein [Bacteroidota bacterium]
MKGWVGAGILLLAGISWAQRSFYPVRFIEFTLANGLHVILQRDTSAPVVATVLYYKVGSRNEEPQRTGFAHFFEHLMFEGTEHIPRATIDKYIQEAGGMLNAFTTFDATVYYFQLPLHQLPLALWIEAERMRRLRIDSVGVETQRGVVKEERKMRYDNSPYGGWMEKLFGRLFAGSPYGWTPIGSAQHIDSARIEEFVGFYNRYYQPNNAVLVIVGDIDPQQARQLVETYFGQYPRGPELPPFRFELPRMMAGEQRDTVYDKKAPQPAVFIGWRGPEKGHPDAYALEMLMDILSEGESSRLYRRLVDETQVAAQASAFYYDLQYAGAIIAIGLAAPEKPIADVERELLATIERVQREGVTDAEFQKARNIREARFVMGKKEALSKALSLASYWATFGDANLINTELERYLQVTREDIQRVARKYFTSDRVVLTYLPAQTQP